MPGLGADLDHVQQDRHRRDDEQQQRARHRGAEYPGPGDRRDGGQPHDSGPRAGTSAVLLGQFLGGVDRQFRAGPTGVAGQSRLLVGQGGQIGEQDVQLVAGGCRRGVPAAVVVFGQRDPAVGEVHGQQGQRALALGVADADMATRRHGVSAGITHGPQCNRRVTPPVCRCSTPTVREVGTCAAQRSFPPECPDSLRRSVLGPVQCGISRCSCAASSVLRSG